MAYRVRLTPEAETDLAGIDDYVRTQASRVVASRYIGRILAFLAGFATTPQRGARRDDVRPGLRIIGFERRVTIAFIVEAEDVVVLRILYGGRQFSSGDA